MDQKRTPHLVPYEVVDKRIKDANRESAAEFIKTLQLFGIFLESPVSEHDEGINWFKTLKELDKLVSIIQQEGKEAVIHATYRIFR